MRPWLLVLLLTLVSCTGPPGSTSTTGAASTVATTATAVTPATLATPMDERAEERTEMVEQDIEGRGIEDPDVLSAMRAVPRHRFVPEGWQDSAYADHPLPIGHGQTISQPYVVALMTEALGVEPGDRVLEIGTGSGYQAAVLAEMGLEVFSIEIIPELAEQAGKVLGDLGYRVQVRTADGYFGWPEEAPFAAVIVTAAPDHVPQPLVEQLEPGGAMVIPVGPIGAVQTLWKFTKSDDGSVQAESLGPVAFVPLTRDED